MENTLAFEETLTVEEFKDRMNVDALHVKPQVMRDAQGRIQRDNNGNAIFHPQKDGMFFITWGAGGPERTGKVRRGALPTRPMMSLCTDTTTGDQFWMLHNEGEGGVADVITL